MMKHSHSSSSTLKRTLSSLPLAVLMITSAIGAEQWAVFEASFTSSTKYENAFGEVEVDVVFRQGENQWKVPAFWAGDSTWTVRFAPPTQGQYAYRVECTDKANPGLNGKEPSLSVVAYTGNNPLLKHGPVRVSANKRHFEHAQGETQAVESRAPSPELAVAIDARPMHIHTALLLLGAEAGNPAMRRSPRGEDKRWFAIPPSGSGVGAVLVFPDTTGKLGEHPISEFITRASEPEPRRDAAGDQEVDIKFPTHKFLFAGSHLVEDGLGPRKYLSDESGNVISIVTFDEERICLPDVHSDQKGDLLWQVNAAGLPAVGTKVTLRLRPQPKPAVKGSVRNL